MITVITVITGDTVEVKYSKHAREQIIARGISTNEVKEATQRGMKHTQQPNKIVSDYKYFSVVYRKIEDVYYIITVKPRW